MGRGEKARILVRKQVPYDVPVKGQCCDLVRSHLSNEELLFRVLAVGVGACGTMVRQRPLFQKLGPRVFASGKAGLAGFLRNKSFFVHEIRRLKTCQPDW
jgi:hypothetical protein